MGLAIQAIQYGDTRFHFGKFNFLVGGCTQNIFPVLQLLKLSIDADAIKHTLMEQGILWSGIASFLEHVFGDQCVIKPEDEWMVTLEEGNLRMTLADISRKPKSKAQGERLFYIPSTRMLIFRAQDGGLRGFWDFGKRTPLWLRIFGERIKRHLEQEGWNTETGEDWFSVALNGERQGWLPRACQVRSVLAYDAATQSLIAQLLGYRLAIQNPPMALIVEFPELGLSQQEMKIIVRKLNLLLRNGTQLFLWSGTEDMLSIVQTMLRQNKLSSPDKAVAKITTSSDIEEVALAIDEDDVRVFRFENEGVSLVPSHM